MSGTTIPREYEGSLCEIKTSENTFITTARLSAVSPDRVKCHIKGKAFRSVRFGTRVKVNIINSKLGLRVIEGKVYTYSFGTLTLTETVCLVESERRKTFRVDMNMTVRAVYENGFTSRSDSAEITIKNMSINGVKFTSPQHFDMGTKLNFRLELSRRNAADIGCTVIRRGSEASGGQMSYIARLTGTNGSEDEICAYLLQKQGELYGKTR